MKIIFTLSLFLLTIFSLSAQSPKEDKKTEVETYALSQAEIQQVVQTEKPKLLAEKKQLELQLTKDLSRQERAAVEKNLEAVIQDIRNNQRILEAKAVQLGQTIEVNP